MTTTPGERAANIFYGGVSAGLALWILVTGSFMSHVANLFFVIPAVTVIVAFVIPPRPRYMMATTFAAQFVNLCFFEYAGPWNDVWRSGGWIPIVGAIAGNLAIVGVVSWRMRTTRTTIRNRKAKVQGGVLKAIGVTLCLFSTFVFLVLSFEPPSHDADIYYISGFGAIILAGYAWYRGKQYDAIARKEWVDNDHRPRVLYLRSFARDESLWQASLSFLLNSQFLPKGRGEEQQLADAVSPIGPLLAVGRPGESLPKPGAHRIYVSDQEWKSTVENLAQEAQLVIIRVETGGEGLWWEIARTFEILAPGRLLLLFMLGEKQQRVAWEHIRKITRIEGLPEWEAATQAFLWLRPDGGPQILKLKAPYWRTPAFKLLRSRFHYALRPVFESLGCEWKPRSVSLSRIAVTLPGVLVILFIILLAVTK